jgi:Cupin-like domain
MTSFPAIVARMTGFWILQLAGTKLVRLIPPSNNWRADATDQKDFQPELFTADIMLPNFEEHPHLHGMLVFETLLEPGDLLYIPEGWAHQALNIDWSCMVSFNYNDDNNLQNRLTYFHYDKVRSVPSFHLNFTCFADFEVLLPAFFLNSVCFVSKYCCNLKMLPKLALILPMVGMQAEEEVDRELEGKQFYLPLINMSRDIGNIPVTDYIRLNILETAPVSDAARSHISKLKRLDIKPDHWRDAFSRRVLHVAVTHNYVALAKWLVEEGVTLKNDRCSYSICALFHSPKDPYDINMVQLSLVSLITYIHSGEKFLKKHS